MNTLQLFALAYKFAPYFLRRNQPQKPGIVLTEKDVALIELRQKEGAVIVILGTRGTGKTELAYRLAEFIDKPIYAVSPEQNPRPDFIQRIKLEEINTIPPGSTLILDDAPTYISSRDYHEALVREVEKIIPVVRHEKKLHLIVISQSGSFIDKWTLDAEAVFLKPPSILIMDVERPGIRKIYQVANQYFEGQNSDWVRRHAFMVTPTWRGIIEVKMVE